MTTIFFETVSARELFDKPAQGLASNIKAAEQDAHHIVESGERVREIHEHGNINESLESTYDGTQCVIDDLAARADVRERKERLFGENVREAFAALRPLWRKK